MPTLNQQLTALRQRGQRLQPLAQNLLCLLMRLSMGWLFGLSGWGKWQHMAQAIGYFESLGLPHADLMAPLTASIELLGGGLLGIGLLTRPAALALTGLMLGAVASAHPQEAAVFADLVGLQEYLLAQGLLTLALLGAGNFSVDGRFRKQT